MHQPPTSPTHDRNQQLLATLRESEEHYRSTVELNPQVPWTADADGNILDFNQRWLDMTGLTREEAQGSGWLQVPHPEDRTAMMAAWTHSVRTGEPYDIEHRIRLASGEYCWMRSRAFPKRDSAGAIVVFRAAEPLQFRHADVVHRGAAGGRVIPAADLRRLGHAADHLHTPRDPLMRRGG